MDIPVFEGEPLFSVVRAIELATSHRPHKSTTFRWMDVGSSGVRMPFVKLGGQRMTSVEAVHRWVAAVTAVSNATKREPISRRQERVIERVEQHLVERGW